MVPPLLRLYMILWEQEKLLFRPPVLVHGTLWLNCSINLIQKKRWVKASDEVQIDLSFNTCPENKLGPDCNTTIDFVPKLYSKMDSLSLSGGDWFYFKVIATPEKGLRVSVQPQSSQIQPNVYASLNQLPTSTSADIKGCNSEYCSPVTVIKLDNSTISSNQTWYIGITSQNDTSFGIWFDSVCSPLCASPYGSCDVTGNCACTSDFIGLDCQNVNGWQAQYIVLLIIASLVVSTAIIGLIAWAYMRKKKPQHLYEKISS